ncbi:regulatory protein, luxR family [Allopseudospirillum japonicum]|uniref:Regulatory protein, luxR family n=1 Tax=Allopseudospirillum japonicum TaxID=64971 RepID=A0A1H6QHN9_9GAMM|nr:LuxR C-terminal-related transcriptional regulator [Allopseudospirillum japonicum]SEI38920.1 regulatory protein, luxR family [Allopseudospirillum japonicum]
MVIRISKIHPPTDEQDLTSLFLLKLFGEFPLKFAPAVNEYFGVDLVKNIFKISQDTTCLTNFQQTLILDAPLEKQDLCKIRQHFLESILENPQQLMWLGLHIQISEVNLLISLCKTNQQIEKLIVNLSIGLYRSGKSAEIRRLLESLPTGYMYHTPHICLVIARNLITLGAPHESILYLDLAHTLLAKQGENPDHNIDLQICLSLANRMCHNRFEAHTRVTPLVRNKIFTEAHPSYPDYLLLISHEKMLIGQFSYAANQYYLCYLESIKSQHWLIATYANMFSILSYAVLDDYPTAASMYARAQQNHLINPKLKTMIKLTWGVANLWRPDCHEGVHLVQEALNKIDTETDQSRHHLFFMYAQFYMYACQGDLENFQKQEALLYEKLKVLDFKQGWMQPSFLPPYYRLMQITGNLHLDSPLFKHFAETSIPLKFIQDCEDFWYSQLIKFYAGRLSIKALKKSYYQVKSSPCLQEYFLLQKQFDQQLTDATQTGSKRKMKPVSQEAVQKIRIDAHQLNKDFNLSAREVEVFTYLLTSRTYEEIAKELNISVNTVKTHASNIYTKTNTRGRLRLISLIQTH